MTSILWDNKFLDDFAEELRRTPSIQFWECDTDGNVMDFKPEHYKKMLNKFFPALGVANLQLGQSDKGTPTSTLVFVRGNRVEQIDPQTLKQITFRIFNLMGQLGVGIRTNFYKEKVFNKDELGIVPDLEGKKVFQDNALSAYRFFKNGFVEITANGVSPLKPYEDIPEEYVIWNSSVIPKDYEDTITKEVLERKLTDINANGIHPDTGELIYSKNDRCDLSKEYQEKVKNFKGSNPPTYFKDFVENLSKDEFGEVDKKCLERLELAIGYLCHRYNSQSQRKYVLLVDRFFDGDLNRDIANGGNGKSLLINTLGTLMNLEILNGKEIKKDASSFKLAQVTTATEIVHFDDAHKKFDADRLNPLVTGNFHIERKYENPFSIPAQNAPKIAVTSNHPIEGNGNTYRRRQFVVEVGHHYRIQDEEYGLTPKQLHGDKEFPLPNQINTEGEPFAWDRNDWNEFYRYVFRCIQLYLSKRLPSGGESEYYIRAKIVQEIGSEEITQFIIDRLNSLEVGKEYFNAELYKELQDTFPDHLENVSTMKMYGWICSVGKLCKLYINQHSGGKQENQRLNEERWEDWVSVGLEEWKNKEGRVMKNPKGLPSTQQDRVGVFKISSMKKVETMVSTPDFSSNKEDKVTTDETPKKRVRKSPKKKVSKKVDTPANLEEFLTE